MNFRNVERLLYTMGRVGTSSINLTLNKANIPGFSVHWAQHGKDSEAEYPALNKELMNVIKKDIGKPMKVIIPIREPIARNVAAFFRILHDKEKYSREEITNCDIEYIQNLFMTNYDITTPDRWFRLEPMDLFNFNPYESDFPHDIGYKIYSVGRHKILIIKLENCNDQLHHALYELLGVEGLYMRHVNEYQGGGSNVLGKDGVRRYEELKTTPLPLEFVKKCYSLDMAQHFWSDEEREKLIKKWTT